MLQPSRDFLDFETAIAGDYSLRRELGRGGMGIVYLARDVQLDRDVATLIDAARLLGEDVRRLADASREADRVAAYRLPAARQVPTPT